MTAREETDVLVVGAGPAGSATAAWLARLGVDVLLTDAAVFPRDKTCGDGLTPRAIGELERLGLGDWLRAHTVNHGLRAHGFGQTLLLPWPGGTLPDWGSAVARTELDDHLRTTAIKAGARAIDGARAVDVRREGERVATVVLTRGDETLEVDCRRLIVADGVRSPLGKVLGRTWHRDTVYGVAGRAYVTSTMADDPWISSHLELRGGVADQRPVGAGHAGHGAAHRQQRAGRAPAARRRARTPSRRCVGVRLHQRRDRDVGRALRGGERADAEVHLAVAEREDPAVAGQHLAVLAAQLEVGADPRVVGHRRGRRRSAPATPYTVSRCHSRPSSLPSGERTPSATTSRRQSTSSVSSPRVEHDGGDPVALAAYVDRPGAVDRAGAGLDRGGAQVVVELGAGDRRAPVGQRCRPATAAAGSGRSRARAGPG